MREREKERETIKGEIERERNDKRDSCRGLCVPVHVRECKYV